jgi:hypothetical protein
LPGIFRQTFSYARDAARTAASTSASPASATSASFRSVAGLIVSNRLRDFAGIHFPPTKRS